MNRKEFENRVLPLSRTLYRFAFRLLASSEDAEDAVQEVCIKLWNMRNSLDQYASLEAFASTVTRNHCLDRIRKQGRLVLEDTRPLDTRTDDMNPEEKMEKLESYHNVLKLVKDLPDKYRTVIQLRDIEGLDYIEIQKQLGENINTIRVNLSRARKMVREQLKTMYYEPAGTG